MSNVAFGCLLILAVFLLLRSSPTDSHQIEDTTRKSMQAISLLTPNTWRNHEPRIAKVSAVVEEDGNDLYEAAIRSHVEHGYELRVLRRPIVEIYWRKPTYLLSIMVDELSKPVGKRVEWLMWVGPDVILRNPQIPLDIFLPPKDFDHVHFLGTHDNNDFDSGVFFIRVHEWSVKLLIEVLAFPKSSPAIAQASKSGQKAFDKVLKTDGNPDHVLYQPKAWYNAYQRSANDYEGEQGSMFVHFQGQGGDKWSAMADTLDQLSQNKKTWSLPLQKTIYGQEVDDYWNRLRQAYDFVDKVAPRISEEPVESVIRRLKYAARFEADKLDIMNEALEMARSVHGMQRV